MTAPAHLREQLEEAVAEVFDGSAYGPLLAQRVQRACTTTLQRLGLRGRVQVLDGGRQVVIGIQDGPRVRTVRLSVG